MNKTKLIMNKIDSKYIKNIKSYNSFLNISNNTLDNSKYNYINEDLYINIDTKNYFNPTNKKDLLLVKTRIDSFKENDKKNGGIEDETEKKV